MVEATRFYIDGRWVKPLSSTVLSVVNPSNEKIIGKVALGNVADVDRAVRAAGKAFTTFGTSSVQQRREILSRIIEAYKRKAKKLAHAVMQEMGAPFSLAKSAHVPMGLAHLEQSVKSLDTYVFVERYESSSVVKEPIGIVGMITPWNWPLNQIACKVGPALAAGCTIVLKPSELAPLSACLFAEIIDEAQVPAGVFNLVNGGAEVGQAISGHPDIDMVSFTGSTTVGIQVAKAAAETVKRVHQELGGKSANILFPDADFETAVTMGVSSCFSNSGQSCNAPSRMFVPRDRQEEAVKIARGIAAAQLVGPAHHFGVTMGPVINHQQAEKINSFIEGAIAEGARLVAGGPGRPVDLDSGFFVRPTVFADVTNDMKIAKEEIFGPVLAIIPYDTVDQALDMANDSPFGLAAYLQTTDTSSAASAAARLRVGSVYINHPTWDPSLPAGGYKQSGNGRERGKYGMDDFMEVKSIAGIASK